MMVERHLEYLVPSLLISMVGEHEELNASSSNIINNLCTQFTNNINSLLIVLIGVLNDQSQESESKSQVKVAALEILNELFKSST